MKGFLAAEGVISDGHGQRRGWVTAEDGVVTGIGTGSCPEEPTVTGFILRDTVNMHTHCADYGLDVPPGLSLEELVAPPDGLKHRYLASAQPERLAQDMGRFSEDSRASGSAAFVDFRENGVPGCRMLREASPDAVILGRPMSPSFDPDEVAEILEVADGIGVSGVSDMDPDYIEEIADAVREARKIFAIHVSERVRDDIDFVLSLDPAFVVHMCMATDDDLAKCAEAEVPVVVCPTSNLYFGREPPIARAQENGVDLALGTDNGMLCRPDMVAEAGVFAEVAGRQGGDPSDCLGALARVSPKILRKAEGYPAPTDPGPVTVLPSHGLDPVEAVRGGNGRIRLK